MTGKLRIARDTPAGSRPWRAWRGHVMVATAYTWPGVIRDVLPGDPFESAYSDALEWLYEPRYGRAVEPASW